MPAASAEPAAVRVLRSVPRRRGLVRGRRGAVLAASAAPVLAVLLALVPLHFNRAFYFYGDTPEGAYGQWYELGEQLLAGEWPLMNPAAWMAGNYAAEGQWGLWNPLVLIIALFVHAMPDAILASTLIKLALFAVGALGVHLLARDFGASPWWALLAAVTAPFTGFTLFMDATSWVTNMMVWCAFSWALWSIRRYVEGRGSFLWPALIGYLLVTIGYVQGTLMLILLYVALLITAAARRRWSELWRTLLIGVVHGLVALAVYLPGVFTSEVTRRTDKVLNDGFMVMTLSGMATGTAPFSLADLAGWWGRFSEFPLMYIAWFLPLVLLVSPRRLRAIAPRLMALGLFGAFVLVLATAPSEMGPLRFPVRSLPWIALVLIVSTVVLLDRGLRRRPGAGTLAAMLGWTAMGAWLVFAAVPEEWHWPRNGTLLAVAALGLGLAWAVARRPAGTRLQRLVLPLSLVVLTLGITTLQVRTYAPLLHSRSDYDAAASTYEDALPEARGDGIAVGNEAALLKPFSDETVYGNFWYLNRHAEFQNVYTPVGFAEYAADTCMEYDGVTCMELATTLTERDAETGLPVADLLSTDTVQLLADGRLSVEQLQQIAPPEGWTVAEVDDRSVMWVRDEPTPPAGTAVWASEGTTFTQGEDSNLSSTVHLDAVGPEGGRIVFSRLDWPGYTVTGGTISEDPVRGYLLTVNVPPGSEGTDVTVRFRPPAWRAIQGAMAAAVLITIAVTVLEVVRGRRRRAERPAVA